MRKIRVKSLEESVFNYVISTIQGTYKYRKHWIKEGFTVEDATAKAINYAVGQLVAGIGSNLEKIKFYADVFRDMAAECNALADILDHVHEDLKKKRE